MSFPEGSVGRKVGVCPLGDSLDEVFTVFVVFVIVVVDFFFLFIL